MFRLIDIKHEDGKIIELVIEGPGTVWSTIQAMAALAHEYAATSFAAEDLLVTTTIYSRELTLNTSTDIVALSELWDTVMNDALRQRGPLRGVTLGPNPLRQMKELVLTLA